MGWQPSKPLPHKATPREKPVLTNCKNCGAPLHGPVCEYCGTVYGDEQQLVMKINTAKLTPEEIAETIQRIRQTQVGVAFVDSGVEFAHMPTMTRR